MKNHPTPTAESPAFDWSFIGLSIAIGLLIAVIANQFVLNQRMNTAHNQPLSYAQAVNAAAGAVISLWAIKRQNEQDDDPRVSSLPSLASSNVRASQGSGIVVSENGYILTNYHVVQGADQLIARLSNGDELEAQLVGSDPATDIAVLKIQVNYPVPAIRFGADTNVQVGDLVLAIGHPFDVGLTVTQGIVSAKSRGVSGFALVEEFIQTDAAINPGNSGGALVNSLGELIGLNTAVYQGNSPANGISFAIPATTLGLIVDQIIAFGEVRRGWLGIQVSPVWVRDTGQQQGRTVLVVTGVYQQSPAAREGVQVGDAITEIDGVAVNGVTDLVKATLGYTPDTRVALRINRQGQRVDLSLPLRGKPKGIN